MLAFLNTCSDACFEPDKKIGKSWAVRIRPWETDMEDTRYGPIGRTKGFKKNRFDKR